MTLDSLTELFSSLIFIAIGVATSLLSFYFLNRTRRFIGESLQTHGEVIGLKEVHDEGSVLYSPIIKYTASDGVTRQFTDLVSSRPASYSVGDRVGILYHRQNPKDARIATTFRLYLSTIVTSLIAIGFLVFGVGTAIWTLARGY